MSAEPTQTTEEAPSYFVRIWLAGDVADARRTCRSFCMAVGECVTVTATDFIYTGGTESGVIVGFVNYPRYPREPASLWERAKELAEKLRADLNHWSVLIEAPDRTIWLTTRPGA